MDKVGIVTLGPEGTDSANAAKMLKEHLQIKDIYLCQTFRDAIKMAKKYKFFLLLPSAYQKTDGEGNVLETWADLNFSIEDDGDLYLWKSIVLPLKVMCIAKRDNVDKIKTCSLHFATDYFRQKYLKDVQCTYLDNKPSAVEFCANGITDACIGSLDLISNHNNLKIIKQFNLNMCWTIYHPNISFTK